MSQEIVVVFDTAQDAGRADLTRLGIIAGANAAGTAVIVEPDIDGWDEIDDSVRRELLRTGMAVAGVFADVLTRAEYDEKH